MLFEIKCFVKLFMVAWIEAENLDHIRDAVKYNRKINAQQNNKKARTGAHAGNVTEKSIILQLHLRFRFDAHR